jgi:ferredoxin-type protein NapH
VLYPLCAGYPHRFWLVRSFFVFTILGSGLLLANAWCRYACPTGGLLELAKRFSLWRVVKTTACKDCDKCRAVCEMDTRPQEANGTNCCDCLAVCPRDAIRAGRALSGPSNEPTHYPPT